MKHCELCKALARTYCESDQASLCWNCDVKVHGANFLVARHSRSVLCHACQSPTPWKASGAELGVTVSVCESCVVGAGNRGEGEDESHGGNDDDGDGDDELDFDPDDDDLLGEGNDEGDDDHDDGDDDDDEDEDGDNQVVPWSATSTTTPPPAASSSSSEESVSRFSNGGGEVSESLTAFSLKRIREISSDPASQDNLGRSFPKRKYSAPASCSGADSKERSVELRPLKDVRPKMELPGQERPVSRSASGFESLWKFRRLGTRNLSKESGALDLDSADSPGRPI
ncbi:B-box-type zinc finger [Parasponia andersonii]|uniref:B-box-type zinc finger n=1 Tax=Parasponia andersonii TaxID=3476 RepID=A0A2P5E4N4_PARAD|nr:B-box-type zinc finger [Parasponia andersonii]